MKTLFTNIERDWAELKCINDMNILKKYSRNSYLYERYLICKLFLHCNYYYNYYLIFERIIFTIFWIIGTTWIVYSSVIIINIAMNYSAYFINVVNVLNEIDYYIFIVFIDIVIIFSVIILISTDSIYISIMHHACAIFDITR